MYISTITISSKGQIVLPKKVRSILGGRVISLEVTDDNQVVLSPIKDVGGSLSSYKKYSNLSWDKLREQAWTDTLTHYKKI